ncbi:nidogen-like domain-containing protein [Ditylenchus destructor]|nr:nidogen-like domain-containing protein [Ditylenchus destructor]
MQLINFIRANQVQPIPNPNAPNLNQGLPPPNPGAPNPSQGPQGVIILPLFIFITNTQVNLSVALLALNRFHAIFFPITYPIFWTRRNIFLSCGLVWLASVAISSPIWLLDSKESPVLHFPDIFVPIFCTLIYFAMFLKLGYSIYVKKISNGLVLDAKDKTRIMITIVCFTGVLPFILRHIFAPPNPGPNNKHGVQVSQDEGASSGPIVMNPPFPFFGKLYDALYVNPDGAITFDTWMSKDVKHEATCQATVRSFSTIAPFWTETSRFNKRSVTWQHINGESEKARSEIISAFPTFHDIKLKWIVAATWLNVTSVSGDYRDRFTMQAIITTDGVRSFAIFYYNEVKYPGKAFFSGFDAGDGRKRHMIAASCETTRATEIDKESNVGSPGKWVFRVDKDKIYEPGSLCPALPIPMYGYCHPLDDFTLGSEAVCGCFTTCANCENWSDKIKILCAKTDNGTLAWAGSPPECDVNVVKMSDNSTTTKPDNAETNFTNLSLLVISLLSMFPILHYYHL